MSYFRLIRLPPQNLGPGGACCWRKQGWVCSAALSSLRGHNARGGRNSDSSNSNFGSSECGGGNSATWVSWSSPRCHASRHALRSDFSANIHTASCQSGYDKSDRMSAIVDIASSSATRRNSNVADLYPHRREISPAGVIYSWSTLSVDEMWGERAYSRQNVLRSRRRVQWTSIRGFAASPPTDKREPSDSTEHSNSQRASLNQRASQGGLLKPTDKEIEPVKDESAPRFKDLQEEYKIYQTARKNPRQASEQVERSQMALTRKKVVAVVQRIPAMTWNATKAFVMFLVEILRNPRSLRGKIAVAQHHLLEIGRHYWLGCKLLWNDIQTANKIISRILRGFPMTRRERKQLLRTASDIFRMVPLAAFVLIPFMEFLLPVALRIFPNMLPSTFQDSLKEEEKLKKELRLRMAYAGFLQETVTEMAVKRKTRAEDGEESEATTAELTEFIEKAKMGEITNQDIPKFAKLFKDELTLDNISRSGLVNMCRYMGLAPFGSDNFLRFQLRAKLRAITQDDQRILWEGVSSLTKQELQEACRERGMRATGLTKQGYVRQLSQWLDLSTKKSVPISLLIMSRAFTLHAPDPAVALAQSISSMDEDVVTEVMIEAASSEEQKTAEYRTRKLESLSRQNELIEEENRKLVEAKEAKKAEAQAEAEAKAREAKKAAEVPPDEKMIEDEAAASAANKAVEEAVSAGVASTSQQDARPTVIMTEGQQHFAAVPASSTKKREEEEEEDVVTEEDLVKAAGTDDGSTSTGTSTTGDRLVEPRRSGPAAAATLGSKVTGDKLAETPEEVLTEEGASDGDADKEDGGKKLTVAELHALESLASPSSVEKEKAQLAMMKAALQESLGKGEPEDGDEDVRRVDAEGGDAGTGEAGAPPPQSPGAKEDVATSSAAEQAEDGAAAEGVDASAAATEGSGTARTSSGSNASATLGKPPREPSPSEEDSARTQEVDEGKPGEPTVDKSVQRVQNKLASMLDRLEIEIQSVESRIGDKLHILDRDKDGMVSAEEIAFVVQHVLTAKSTAQEAKAIAAEMDTDSDGQISVADLIAWVKKHSEQDAEDVFNQLYHRREPTKPSE